MEEIRAHLYDDDTPELSTFPPLPEGQHLLEVIDVKPGTAQTGRGRLGLQVKIVGGEAADQKGWYNLNLPVETDKKDGYIRKVWKTIGKILPEAVTNDVIRPELLKGLQFRATVSIEDYQGKKVNRFKNETFIGLAGPESHAPDMA